MTIPISPQKQFEEWLNGGGLGDLTWEPEEWLDRDLLADDELVEAPLLPLRDLVVFPHMVTPLFVGRASSMQALDTATQGGGHLIVAAQHDSEQVDPTPADLYTTGVLVSIGRLLHMPDGTTSVLAHGERRIEIVEFTQVEPFFCVRVRPLWEPTDNQPSTQALMLAVLTMFEKVVQLDRNLSEEVYVYALNTDDPGWLADLVTPLLNFSLEERQEMLELVDPAARLQRLSVLLGQTLNVLELEDQIHVRVQREVDKGQRELILREQMRVIQNELGEQDPHNQELVQLREKAQELTLPEKVQARVDRELKRLAAMPSMSPEVGILRTYLEWILDLPWDKASDDNLDVKHAAQVLDDYHYGLPKAKERILEYIAVRRLLLETSSETNKAPNRNRITSPARSGSRRATPTPARWSPSPTGTAATRPESRETLLRRFPLLEPHRDSSCTDERTPKSSARRSASARSTTRDSSKSR